MITQIFFKISVFLLGQELFEIVSTQKLLLIYPNTTHKRLLEYMLKTMSNQQKTQATHVWVGSVHVPLQLSLRHGRVMGVAMWSLIFCTPSAILEHKKKKVSLRRYLKTIPFPVDRPGEFNSRLYPAALFFLVLPYI